ncbi:MAG: copper transporter [Nocardiopsaceae bacterium]|nr:copper transporter [Nocardiopsaceae bacterium]
MIDFRYHLVSIVAVFLALAVGIVLGSTELQGPALGALETTSDSLRSQLSATSAERDSYQAQSTAAEQFLQTAEPVLLDGRLAGQRVVLITEPGASSGVTGGVRQALATANATVTGQIDLQPKFSDISGATQSSLGAINGSIASRDGITLTPGADARTADQQQAAQLIATAIMASTTDNSNNGGGGSAHGLSGSGGGTSGGGASGSGSGTGGGSGGSGSGTLSPASVHTLLSAYAQEGYLTVSGAPARATLAVVVVPDNPPPGGQNDPVNQVLLVTAQEFASASAAAVAAGSTAGSAQSGSSISVLRSSSASAKMSTVDNADTTLGQISAVEALAAQLAGRKPDSYGVSGASAVSPDPLPSQIATSAPPQPGQTGKGKK